MITQQAKWFLARCEEFQKDGWVWKMSYILTWDHFSQTWENSSTDAHYFQWWDRRWIWYILLKSCISLFFISSLGLCVSSTGQKLRICTFNFNYRTCSGIVHVSCWWFYQWWKIEELACVHAEAFVPFCLKGWKNRRSGKHLVYLEDRGEKITHNFKCYMNICLETIKHG